MSTMPAPAILIVPPGTHNVSQFCQDHLAGLFGRVSAADLADVTEPGPTGALIAQTLALGTIRPLQPLLTAAPSATLQALPADFPTGHTKRLVAAHAILLALSDVPAVRLSHLLLRAEADASDPEAVLAELGSSQRRTFEALVRLLQVRAEHAAFADTGDSHPMVIATEVFAVVRTAAASTVASTLPLHQRRVVCLTNVSSQEQLVSVDWRAVLGTRHAIRDLVSGVRFNVHGPSLALQPYQALWATL